MVLACSNSLCRIKIWHWPGGHIQHRIDLLCADDNEAKERDQQLVNDQDIELWQRDRLIATFPHEHNGH
jgi:hypothetical protein